MRPITELHRADAAGFFTRCSIAGLLAFLLVFALPGCLFAAASNRQPADYSRLVELIRLEDQTEPVYAFNEFEEKFDREGHRNFLEYFNSNHGLVKKIKSELGGSRLRWKLRRFEKRLVFVPENRKEYAELYRSYCMDAIEFVLDQIQIPNPYNDLITIDRDRPPIGDGEGIVVFLVHNLARQYRGTYLISAENTEEEVEISLNGTVFVGEVGSYTSILEIKDGGDIEFERQNYTIWQDSANLPYNALVVPIEETLHIALRPYTEKAIDRHLHALAKKNLTNLQELVNQWTAIEEAVVGGLVNLYFPRLARRHFRNINFAGADQALETRSNSARYRFLKNGIDLVERVGETEAVEMYRNDTDRFRELLLEDREV